MPFPTHLCDKFKNKPKFKLDMSQKRFLSHNSMDKIMREVSALRVADNAKEALANILEQQALEISIKAKNLAEHAGRKTITDKDIRLAVKSNKEF